MIQQTIINFFKNIGKTLNENETYYLNAIESKIPNTICFAENETYLLKAIKNTNCSIILTNIESMNMDTRVVKVSNPRITYFELYNLVAKINLKEFEFKTKTGINNVISPNAIIAVTGVTIGNNCEIHAGAIILSGSEIGNNCIIHSGAVIAAEGFEIKQTEYENITVIHDGKAILGNNVSIGSNTSVDRGFKTSPTSIGNFTRIDSLVKISHGVKVGSNTLIVSNSYIAGAATIGNKVYIGPNSSIANVKINDNAYITMGSVVVNNVKTYEKVSGNFAINHTDNLLIHQNKLRELRKLKKPI